MLAVVPLNPYATLGVTVMPVPTEVWSYVNVGDPEIEMVSPLRTPLSVGVPIAVAVFVRSYVLLKVGGVIVTLCCAMVAVVVGAPERVM